jgi:hypothetical protein
VVERREGDIVRWKTTAKKDLGPGVGTNSIGEATPVLVDDSQEVPERGDGRGTGIRRVGSAQRPAEDPLRSTVLPFADSVFGLR